MSIDILSEWNLALSRGAPYPCGCCQMPGCPTPTLECGSAQIVVADDYYLPMGAPVPDDEDELPRIYTGFDINFNTYLEGTTWRYFINNFGPPGDPNREQHEELVVSTASENPLGGTSWGFEATANYWTAVGPTCGPTPPLSLTWFDPTPLEWSFLNENTQCTETRYRYDMTEENVSGTALALAGCPGPFVVPDDPVDETAWSLLQKYWETTDVTGPLTKQDIKELAETGFVEDIYPGTDCEASWFFTHKLFEAEEGWPTRGSVSDIKNWFICDDIVYSVPVWCYVQRVRYRWVVPDTFEGTYFKVTWDVLTEPTGWDDTINDPDETLPDPLPEGYDTPEEWWADHQVPKPGRPTRTYIQDLTWEWTGPGDPEDADSWKSDWYYLTVPPQEGTRRVVNIRYECYRSPYGQKPETMGEGVDLDDDIPLQRRLTSDRHSIKLPSITI